MNHRIISTVGTSMLGHANRAQIDPHNPQALLQFLSQQPQKYSAEANAISRGDELIFLHSDTTEGQMCSTALVEYYQQNNYKARSVCIEGLNYNEKGFVQYGLQKFVKLLAQEIRAARQAEQLPKINATGRFKAEIAYATAVGLVFSVDVCYIHEKFNDIVTLPATPMSWNYSLFAWYGDFF